MPVGRPKEDRDDAGLAGVVTFEGARHLAVEAVIGGKEVGADEEEDHLGLAEVLVDLASPRVSGSDAAVMPTLEEALAFEEGEVDLQLVTERLVLVGIAEEEADGLLRRKALTKKCRSHGIEMPKVAVCVACADKLLRYRHAHEWA